MSVLTRPKTEIRYHNMVTIHLLDTPELPENLDRPLTLYVSSLLTGENISRLTDFANYINQLDNVINLQDEVYASHQILGEALLKELRLGSLSPLVQAFNVFDLMLRKENPFSVFVERMGYKVPSHVWFTGFQDTKNKRHTDCILHRLFINALYNLVYLYPHIKILSEAWLFSVLLARVNDNPDSCLESAQTAVSTMLYNACQNYTKSMPDKPTLIPPSDPLLLGTFNQIKADAKESYYPYRHTSLMLHIILAPKTVPYEAPDIPTSKLLDLPIGGTFQDRTNLLPSRCSYYRLGTTDFRIPMLEAISAHHTHVLLLPATMECYKFLCALYGLTPYDGITPLPEYFQKFYQTMFQPDVFVSTCVLTNSIAEYVSGRVIFNKQASLTDYIPDLPSSDSPQFMVNEFEAPRICNERNI